MKKNVGDMDRFIRISAGLLMLGQGINRHSNLWMALGAMKVAEGITRYCPMLDMLGLSTNKPMDMDMDMDKKQKTMHKVRRAVSRLTEDY